MRKKYRKNDNQFFYWIDVKGWDAHVSFNDYAYINLFDRDPFEEQIYITLNGKLNSTMSKKVKKGVDVSVVLHPRDYYYGKRDVEFDNDPIGDIVLKNEDIKGKKHKNLTSRVRIPTKSYELIRSYLTYKPKGQIELVGSDLYRGKGDIFYMGFNTN